MEYEGEYTEAILDLIEEGLFTVQDVIDKSGGFGDAAEFERSTDNHATGG